MKYRAYACRIVSCLALSACGAIMAQSGFDPAVKCGACEAWNLPAAPCKVFGNTYYVGPKGVSSVLVVSNQGLILLDGALPQSASQIVAHIEALGFHVADIKIILNSHEHFDHAGGIAALQRLSGAKVYGGAASANAMNAGHVTAADPQADLTETAEFPRVKGAQAVKDGEVLQLGNVAITAHRTPGHTPGSTSWSWKSCEAERCLNVVYADSLNPVSAPSFRFSGDAKHPETASVLRHSIASLAALPCDILIPVHSDSIDLWSKLAARKPGTTVDPLIDSNACKNYAAMFDKKLDERLAQEKANSVSSAMH